MNRYLWVQNVKNRMSQILINKMEDTDNASSAIIASGAIRVQNPFALEILGSISLGELSSSRALIYCASGAEVHWAEKRD